MVYTIELNYNAKIVKVVEANDEGDALNKARELAEESPIDMFEIADERESSIINNM